MSIASAKQVGEAILAAPKRAITPVVINKFVHSAWCEGKNFHLVFTDCTELTITWGDVPEIRGRKTLASLPAAPIADGEVSRILSGRKVQYAYINEHDDLLVRCWDDHEAVIGWHNNGPVLRSMNVKLELQGVSMTGVAQAMG